MSGQQLAPMAVGFAAAAVLFLVIGYFLTRRNMTAHLAPVKRELKKEKQWLRRGEYNAAMVKGRQNLELFLKLVAEFNGIYLDNSAQAMANAKNSPDGRQQKESFRMNGKKRQRVMTFQQFGWWLDENGYLDRVGKWEMNEIRVIGNKAVHENYVSKEDAWNQYNYMEDLLKIVSDHHANRHRQRGPEIRKSQTKYYAADGKKAQGKSQAGNRGQNQQGRSQAGNRGQNQQQGRSQAQNRSQNQSQGRSQAQNRGQNQSQKRTQAQGKIQSGNRSQNPSQGRTQTSNRGQQKRESGKKSQSGHPGGAAAKPVNNNGKPAVQAARKAPETVQEKPVQAAVTRKQPETVPAKPVQAAVTRKTPETVQEKPVQAAAVRTEPERKTRSIVTLQTPAPVQKAPVFRETPAAKQQTERAAEEKLSSSAKRRQRRKRAKEARETAGTADLPVVAAQEAKQERVTERSARTKQPSSSVKIVTLNSSARQKEAAKPQKQNMRKYRRPKKKPAAKTAAGGGDHETV